MAMVRHRCLSWADWPWLPECAVLVVYGIYEDIQMKKKCVVQQTCHRMLKLLSNLPLSELLPITVSR